ENTADTLLALLARAEAAEAQVAAAVQAEREACAAVCDDKDATSRSFGSHADAYEIAARLIRARGPSDALADALRQAE
ncbi:hypothetical protein ABK046_52225, partial [Streptomyces caeruleatus]